MTPIHTKNRTIGLLGGSFNPAHAGHLHITLHALRALKLDEVWWLVSPRNPLKTAESLNHYEQRLQSAQRLAAPYKRIRVLDIERRFNTRYSYETIALLRRKYPGARFVWMIGADNLAQFHRWKRWQTLLATIPILIFDRAPYSHTSLRSKAMLRGHRFLKNNAISSPSPRWGEGRGGGFKGKLFPVAPSLTLPPNGGGDTHTPRLTFIHLKRNPLSSTSLRKKLGKGAFLGHTEL